MAHTTSEIERVYNARQTWISGIFWSFCIYDCFSIRLIKNTKWLIQWKYRVGSNLRNLSLWIMLKDSEVLTIWNDGVYIMLLFPRVWQTIYYICYSLFKIQSSLSSFFFVGLSLVSVSTLCLPRSLVLLFKQFLSAHNLISHFPFPSQ